MKALIFLLIFTCMLSNSALAQANKDNNLTKANNTIKELEKRVNTQAKKINELKKKLDKGDESKPRSDLTQEGQVCVILGIIILGILIITLFFALAKKNKELQEQSLKLFVVVSIITGSLLIIALKRSTTELAPLLGLFGTIAGYLLGKGREQIEQKKQVTSKIK